MSRIYKKKYSNFSREILAEFMNQKELTELDRKYNEAKVKREIKRIENQEIVKIEFKLK